MSKALGALLILSGSTYLFIRQVTIKRQEISLLISLIGALRVMENAIRWKGQAVPDCLQELQSRKVCGRYFVKCLNLLQSGIALHAAWQRTFQDLPQDINEVLQQMEWVGDERHLIGGLQMVLQGLSELLRQRQTQQRSHEQLLMAAIGSAAGLLIIILL